MNQVYRIILFVSFYISTLCLTFSQTPEVYSELRNLLQNKKIDSQLSILQDTIRRSNDNQKVISASNLFLEIALLNKNDKKIAKGYLNIGKSYWLVDNYLKSTEYLFKAREYSQTIKDTATQITADIYIGLVYEKVFDFDKVEKYYSEALHLSKSANRTFDIASSLWNLALLRLDQKEFKTSIELCNEALNYLQILPNQHEYLVNFGYGLANLYKGLSNTHLKNYDSALFCYHKSISYYKTIKNDNLLAGCYRNISWCFNEMNLYDSAIVYGKLGVSVSEKNSKFSYLADSYEQIYRAYQKSNNEHEAFNYYRKFKEAKDSVNKYDARAISAKIELENAEKQFLADNERREAERFYIIIISSISISALLVILAMLYSRNKWRKKVNSELSGLNATKDKFFMIISHDLKTPIASFKNLAELLVEYYNDLSESDKMKQVTSLKNSSANILKLLDNLLTWSQLQTNQLRVIPEDIQLTTLIDIEIQNQEQSAEKKNLSITSTIKEDTTLYADKEMVSGILRNVLSNAIKYSLEKGTITFSSVQNNGFYDISVSDNGIGIKDEDKLKIFAIEKKHSTIGTANERGTGLGLNLCKEFAEKNNGTIRFESELGKGSTFIITLPKAN